MSRPAAALALATTLLVACEPGDPLQGGAASATLSFERADTRDDGTEAVDLDVVAALVFPGRAPGAPAAGAACDAQGGVRHPFALPVAVDLSAEGRVVIGRLTVGDGELGQVGELRLLVRSARVDAGGGRREAHGRMTCRDGDGDRIVLRLEPDERIELERGRDHDLRAAFHARGDVAAEACRDSGDDSGDDDGPDRCHREGGGGGSRILLGQSYPLILAE